MQMFSILNEINDNSHWNTTSVVFASIGSAAGTYILVAITGYLSFGNSVGPNIVGMYPPGLWATIGRAAIVILVMFSYPLQVHPCRASADAVLRWRPKSSTPNGNDGSPNRHPLLGPRGNRAPLPILAQLLDLVYIFNHDVLSIWREALRRFSPCRNLPTQMRQ